MAADEPARDASLTEPEDGAVAPPPKPDLYVVLSDDLRVAVLVVTWVILLLALLWLRRRNRALHARLED
jgi:uncharacterized membrane protein YozB (DUF420 family)